MKRILAGLAVVLVGGGAFASEAEHIIYGTPELGHPIHHMGYSCGYKSVYRSSLWVAYHLTPKYSEGERIIKERPDFYKDPVVVMESMMSAERGDIIDSGYWPIPMFSHSDALGRGEQCEKEVYSLANMLAQTKSRGMRDMWKELEDQVRKWAVEFGEVWVICGPVFDAEPEKTRLGRIPIPSAFYKIVIRKDGEGVRTIAFKVPQNGSGKLNKYLVSIDQIESETGLDFLKDLDDAMENDVERKVSSVFGKEATARSDAAAADEGPAKAPSNAGEVWVNKSAGIFYYPDHPKYGRGDGSFMDESTATLLGFRGIKK